MEGDIYATRYAPYIFAYAQLVQMTLRYADNQTPASAVLDNQHPANVQSTMLKSGALEGAAKALPAEQMKV